MRIATWNINSIRLRIQLVTDFIREHDIDVVCLQETKTEDQHFPAAAFAEAGWPHQVFRGEKSYNGVAIISDMHYEVSRMWWQIRCRHIAAVTADGVRLSFMCQLAVIFPIPMKTEICPSCNL